MTPSGARTRDPDDPGPVLPCGSLSRPGGQNQVMAAGGRWGPGPPGLALGRGRGHPRNSGHTLLVTSRSVGLCWPLGPHFTSGLFQSPPRVPEKGHCQQGGGPEPAQRAGLGLQALPKPRPCPSPRLPFPGISWLMAGAADKTNAFPSPRVESPRQGLERLPAEVINGGTRGPSQTPKCSSSDNSQHVTLAVRSPQGPSRGQPAWARPLGVYGENTHASVCSYTQDPSRRSQTR